ncbi:uncharacterized protein LOC132740509, partial [Ruditapes philippinarum]|uniref:uncharacterized protein LOC132740509 n=1 Tax=Ruditapes philippinarum TaxID=129788 RepID=UPI00295B7341
FNFTNAVEDVPNVSTGSGSSPNTNPEGLHDVLADEIAVLLNSSVSEKTKQIYNQAINAFKNFRCLHELPGVWPPPVDHMVNFIGYLSLKKFAFATVNSYLSGISFFLKMNGIPDNTQSFIVKKMLCGMRRIRSKKDLRVPITLQVLLRFPMKVAYSNYESILYITAFVCAFFGFLRVGEIAVDTKKSDTNRVVQLGDLRFSENECFLTIRFSKTDQFGSSVTLTFCVSHYPEICPYILLRHYITLRPQIDGPLFCHFSGQPMTKYQFRFMLRKCLNFPQH